MSTPKRGLGRGLGSLIPPAPTAPPDTAPSEAADRERSGDPSAATANQADSDLTPVDGAEFAEIPVDEIRPNPKQPRTVFDEDALAELEHSVREVGLLQPIVVRRLGSPDDDRGGYELVMGERRWRATQRAGLPTIPAIVRDTTDDDLLRDALLENLHRAQLNPLEEAAAYQQLLDDFGCTHEELASRLGRSRPQISNTLRLLNLSAPVQRRVAAGVLSAGHARTLVAVTDPARQDELAARVVAEGISVRGLEELVSWGTYPIDTPVRQPRRPAATDPSYVEAADRLAERLETRCRVTGGRSRGKITVDFAGPEDLQRILAIIDPAQ